MLQLAMQLMQLMQLMLQLMQSMLQLMLQPMQPAYATYATDLFNFAVVQLMLHELRGSLSGMPRRRPPLGGCYACARC
jgi:hypothetical protein